jgi:hypothetical protein
MRAGRRDADTWKAFNRIRTNAKTLLATAETQLQQLPAEVIQPRWSWQLDRLDTALNQLTALQEEWRSTRDSLPSSARPGTAEYDNARAERNAEAWHYLDEWASAGETVLEIHRAAQQAPLPLTTPPLVRVPAPPAAVGHTAAARR